MATTIDGVDTVCAGARRLRRRLVAVAVAVAVVPLALPGPVLGSPRPAAPGDAVTTVVDRYRARIPELLADQSVPGLAVALVDEDQALWVEGFGHTGRGSAPVTIDTIFGVQSMSKLFTATAVMQSVAAGHLDLDEPISTYLPDFTVHSAFEDHPERTITLRMLLSHTAGFTLEAPVGNNNQLDPGDFAAHVESIADTWLRFPVGSGYAYSNLGIDLAGHILERVEGKPFDEVVQETLLGPLDMEHSTFDRAAIRATTDRAIGHVSPYPQPPLDVPMTAAGGLYTSASDLARFLRFELGDGSLDGRVVLEAQSMEIMRTVPAPRDGAPAGYALGMTRHRWNRWSQGPDLFDHGGGGFGFLADLWWAPEVGLGVAVLTNSQDHELQGNLALSILGDVVSESGVYRDRMLALPSRLPVEDPDAAFVPPPDMAALVAGAAMPRTGDDAARWATHAGSYRAPAWGYIAPNGRPDRFLVDAGTPYFETDETESLTRHRLTEIAPDLFLADNGETLDLRRRTPTWRGLELVPVAGAPAPWQWAIVATAAALAMAWSVAAAVRTIRTLRSREASTRPAGSTRRWRRLAAATAASAAALTLATAVLITVLPGIVDSGFLGDLDLPLAQKVATHLPLALAAAGGAAAVLTAAGWLRGWWPRPLGLQYAALALGVSSLVWQLAAWHLLGWSPT